MSVLPGRGVPSHRAPGGEPPSKTAKKRLHVATPGYRPPELLLGLEAYSFEGDCGGLGVVLAETAFLKPLFPLPSLEKQMIVFHDSACAITSCKR
jgi:serine/threonine protein kinase